MPTQGGNCIRLHPITQGNYAHAALPERLITSNNAGIGPSQYDLQTCGFSSAILHIYALPGFSATHRWDWCDVQITHSDGKTETVKVGKAGAGVRGHYLVGHPIRLDLREGSSMGQITITLTMFGSLTSGQVSPWRVVYTYGRSSFQDSTFSDRCKQLDLSVPHQAWSFCGSRDILTRLALTGNSVSTASSAPMSSQSGSSPAAAAAAAATSAQMATPQAGPATADTSISSTATNTDNDRLRELKERNDSLQVKIEKLEEEEERKRLLERKAALQRRLQELEARQAESAALQARGSSISDAIDLDATTSPRKKPKTEAAEASTSPSKKSTKGSCKRTKTEDSEGSSRQG